MIWVKKKKKRQLLLFQVMNITVDFDQDTYWILLGKPMEHESYF